jgi:hypothetical protein
MNDFTLYVLYTYYKQCVVSYTVPYTCPILTYTRPIRIKKQIN